MENALQINVHLYPIDKTVFHGSGDVELRRSTCKLNCNKIRCPEYKMEQIKQKFQIYSLFPFSVYKISLK